MLLKKLASKKKKFLDYLKGFTLIELLVVIAIIGVLSAVVLGSVNSAKTKAVDAGIKQNLINIRSQAQIFYDTNGGYYSSANINGAVGGCSTLNSVFANTNVTTILNALTLSNASPVCVVAGGTASTKSTKYSVSVSTSDSSWCIDSTQISEESIDSNSDGDCGA